MIFADKKWNCACVVVARAPIERCQECSHKNLKRVYYGDRPEMYWVECEYCGKRWDEPLEFRI